MQQEDFARLRDDIKFNGYDKKYPIFTYQGAILDGWNRQRACDELTVTPTYEVFVGTDLQAIEFVMRTNKRRNLDSSQWATVAVEAEELVNNVKRLVEEESKKKMAEAKIGNENASKEKQPTQLIVEVVSNINREHPKRPISPNIGFDITQKSYTVPKIDLPPATPRSENETAHKVAELFNTNRTYVNEARKIRESNPVAFEAIKRGEKTIPQVKKEIKAAEKKEQKVFIAKQMPDDVFDLIYCDPPWQYDFAETDNRKIENQYPTMSVNEICTMKLPNMAPNCLLLMWATAPKLLEALDVIDAWGFKYKTHGIWDKVKIGMGYWFRGQHELLIVATKGNYSPPDSQFRESSIFCESRGAHSKKPLHYYEWIDQAFPLAHKIELFSRLDRDNWKSWGNE